MHVSVTRDRGGSADVVAGLAIVHALGVVVLQFDAFAQECGEDGGTAVVVAVLAAITAAEEDRRELPQQHPALVFPRRVGLVPG